MSEHGRPRFAKLSFHGGGKEQIAPVHPDFGCGILPLSLMGLAGWLPIAFSHSRRSSQNAVDTLLPPCKSSLELLWANATEVKVSTGSIVKGVDVIGDVLGCELAGLVDVLLDSLLLLETAEEGFDDRVVPAVPPSAHAWYKAVRPTKSPPVIASVLRPLIRVDDGLLRPPPPNRQNAAPSPHHAPAPANQNPAPESR
jgi:hypothetical protein